MSDRGIYRFLQCTTGEYMTRSVISVTRDLTLRELELLFERHDFNSFPVLDAGTLVGIVTKFDFLKAFAFTTGQMVPHYDELMQQTVAEVMSEEVGHVEPTTPLTRILQLMVEPHDPQPPCEGPRRQVRGYDIRT